MNALTKLIRRITNQGLLDKLFMERRRLRKAANTVLCLYVKEVTVLTPERLKAIRGLRDILDRGGKNG